MVDTFTCDSCGKNSIKESDKQELLLVKRQLNQDKKNASGKPTEDVITDGMDVCPDCAEKGVRKNHTEVHNDGEKERRFSWNPNPEKHSVKNWSEIFAQRRQQGQQQNK